jgi:hypothetical protein
LEELTALFFRVLHRWRQQVLSKHWKWFTRHCYIPETENIIATTVKNKNVAILFQINQLVPPLIPSPPLDKESCKDLKLISREEPL